MGLLNSTLLALGYIKASSVGDLRVGSRAGQPIYEEKASKNRDRYAEEAMKASVAYAAIRMVAVSFASVDWKVIRETAAGDIEEIDGTELESLWRAPNNFQSGAHMRALWSMYYSIHGEAPLERVMGSGGAVLELHNVEPEKVAPIYGKDGDPLKYEYRNEGRMRTFDVDASTGQCDLRFIKAPNPVGMARGLAPTNSAGRAIDTFNAGAEWNAALLQNSAQPSGILNVKGTLTDEQRERLTMQMREKYGGSGNNGKPMVLSGEMDWHALSMSPRELDFLEGNREAARYIALVYGVPPMLLGIPGDNTYSNYSEARLALYDETIIPLLNLLANEVNNWLAPISDGLRIIPCIEQIPALEYRKEKKVESLSKATWLSVDEKRIAMGYEPLGEDAGGDVVEAVSRNSGMFDLGDMDYGQPDQSA